MQPQHLLDAFERREFAHAYQPIISMSETRTVHYEALARWIHPTLGPIGPGSFLSLIHGSGLSDRFADYGVELALADLPRLREVYGSDVSVAVNLSHPQLLDPQATVDRIIGILDRSPEDPTSLCIEVVEDLGRVSIEPTTRAFARLRELGVQIFLDDFGTGASSLTQLTEMAYDGIKVDRSFVAGVRSSATARSVIEAIIAFGASTGIAITAEGIESALEYNMLAEMGCGFAQGYFIERPKLIDDVRAVAGPVLLETNVRVRHRVPEEAEVKALRDEIEALSPRATGLSSTEFVDRADELDRRLEFFGADVDLLRCELGRRRVLHGIYASDFERVRRSALNTSTLAERIGAWGYSAECLAMLAADNGRGADRDSGLRVEALTKALELRFTKPIDRARITSVDNAIGAAFASLGLWPRAGKWWRTSVELHASTRDPGMAMACVNLIEMELNALEGDAWFVAETPRELGRELVEQTLGLLAANPHAPDGVTQAFRCRIRLLDNDVAGARAALNDQPPPADLLGGFLGNMARAKLAKAAGEVDEFLKYATRQVEVLDGHALLAHHEQIARKLLAEAHLAAGDAEQSVAILLESYDRQFFADARRLKSLFNWIRLNADLNARVAELLEIGVIETAEFDRRRAGQ